MADRSPHLSLPPVSLHLLSGAISGLASCVVLQPFDLLKTRLQQFHLHSQNHVHMSVYRVSSEVVLRDGVLGLWRGTAPTILRNVPGIALYFYGLAQLRSSMSRINLFSQPSIGLFQLSNQSRMPQPTVLAALTPTGDFFAGVLTRTAVGFLLMPITVIKTRFESNLYDYRSIREAFQDIVRRQGARGLWRGFLPTVMRDAPFAGVFVSTYEACKRLIPLTQSHPLLLHTFPATTAAIVATIITAPFDLLKTDLQLRSNPPSSMFNTVKVIFSGQLSNATILFKGSTLRLIRKSLSSAIGWTVYEGLVKKWAIAI